MKQTKRQGGRAKGTPNKRTAEAAELMASYKYNPLVGMILIAQERVTCKHCRGKGKGRFEYNRTTNKWVKLPSSSPGGIEMDCPTCDGTKMHPISISLQADMHRTLAEYGFAKRKAIEVTSPDGTLAPQLTVVIHSSLDEEK